MPDRGVRGKILALILTFVPAFVICLIAYPLVQPHYQKAVVAAIDVGLHRLEPPMRIEIIEHGGWKTYELRPDGTESFYWSRPGENLTLFYMALALLPALLIATPIGFRRRVRLLVIGMLVLYALQVVAGFGLVVSIRCLATDPDAIFCTWAKTIGNTFGQVSAFVIWVALTWHVWIPGGTTTAGAGASGSTIGRGLLARNPALTSACVVSVVTLFAVYGDQFDYGFHLNDTDRIVDNLSIRSLRNTGAFFGDPQTLSTRPDDAAYRPLLTLSHALDAWAAGGVHARQFRRTQFGLFVALGVMLAVMFTRLFDLGRGSWANRWAALAAALVFCVHVANAGTLNDLASRSDLIGALGIATCFCIYLGWPNRRRTGLFLVPMFAGALAEPLTLAFAPLLVIFVRLFERPRSFRTALGRCAPALGLALGLFVFLRWMGGAAAATHADGGALRAALGQPFAWFGHAWAFVVPTGGPVVDEWPLFAGQPALRVAIGTSFVVALIAAIGWCSRRAVLRPAAFGLAWFALTSFAVSARAPALDGPLGNPAFVPYVGLTLAAAWLVASGLRLLHEAGLPAVRPLAGGLVVAVVTLHGLAAAERSRLWRDDATLWAAVLRDRADEGRALLNHGRALAALGRHDDALRSLERAEPSMDGSAVYVRALAQVRAGLGQNALAEQQFERAVRHAPRDTAGRGAFARWLVSRARAPEAIEQAAAAVDLSPNDADASRLLMNLYAASGDDAALAAVSAATLETLPTDHVALAYTGGRIPVWAATESATAYAELGRRNIDGRFWLDAAVNFRQAVTLDPSAPELFNYLAWTRMQLGFHEAAIAAYRESLTLDPTSAQTWNDLGWAQTQLEQFDAAVASFETAVALDPSMSRARGNLEWARRQAAEKKAGG